MALVACQAGPASVPDDWVEFIDEEKGLEVSYPSGWVRADVNLTPNLMGPRELLSIGTFPLQPGGPACAQIPTNALIELGPEDTFLTLQGGLSQSPADHRPVFGPRVGIGMSELVFPDCLPEDQRSDIGRMQWIQFSDAGRGFYLLVAIGSEANSDVQGSVWAAANSLVFYER